MHDDRAPLFRQIHDQLLRDILDGRLRPGDRLPTEAALSATHGVSRITCRKALGLLVDTGHIVRMPGRGSHVADPLPNTGAVLSAPGQAPPADAAASDTVPRYVQTGTPHAGRPLLLGFVLPDFDETYGTALLSGIEQAAAREGAFVIIRRSYDDQAQEERVIGDLLQLGVDGLMLMPVHGEHYAPKILQLVLDRFPLVFTDRHLRGLNASFVGTDNVGAARLATDYLLSAGHHAIAFLSPPHTHTTAIEDRLEGYVKSHAARGIAVDEHRLLTTLTSTLPGRHQPENIRRDTDAIQALLRSQPTITCLFAAEYNIAELAETAAAEMGLRIPRDLSLVCFDSPRRFMEETGLTHLRQREAEMGETAVALLMRQLKGPPQHSESIFLDADLIMGRSTAPPGESIQRAHMPAMPEQHVHMPAMPEQRARMPAISEPPRIGRRKERSSR